MVTLICFYVPNTVQVNGKFPQKVPNSICLSQVFPTGLFFVYFAYCVYFVHLLCGIRMYWYMYLRVCICILVWGRIMGGSKEKVC